MSKLAAKLAAKLKLVNEMQAEVAKREATYSRTGKAMDKYLLESANKELTKAINKYERYKRKLEKKGIK